jgi:uncharacterized membrane protein YhdT
MFILVFLDGPYCSSFYFSVSCLFVVVYLRLVFYKHTVPLLLRTGYWFEVTCMINWLANINITYDERREDINEEYFSLYVTVMVNLTRQF